MQTVSGVRPSLFTPFVSAGFVASHGSSRGVWERILGTACFFLLTTSVDTDQYNCNLGVTNRLRAV